LGISEFDAVQSIEMSSPLIHELKPFRAF